MPIPVADYPTLSARDVLKLLERAGYQVERTTGNRRKLSAPNRDPIWLTIQEGSDVPAITLRHMLVRKAALSESTIRELLGRR